MNADRITFLVGSGISKASDAPMVGDLSKQVLESPWRPHTDWRFYPVPLDKGLKSEGLAAKAQKLILILHDQIEDHIRTHEGRDPNYEDYFACLRQIVQDETCEYVNPLIHQNVETLRTDSSILYNDIDPHINENRFASLADRASDLIQCVVYHALRKLKKPIGMELFLSVAKHFNIVDIFSLNHDLLIENYFENKNISYCDGFGDIDGDATLFNWSWGNACNAVRLFKLHGSVDWYLFRFENRGIDQYAKIRKDPDHAQDTSGRWLSPLNTVPSFLTGTTIKEQVYGYSLYGELFEQFRHRLRETVTLICSGYGWSDKGINIRINQWLRDSPLNRVVILHGEGGEELRSKRFWHWKWNDYVKAGKVFLVPKWFSDCTLDDLKPYLQNE